MCGIAGQLARGPTIEEGSLDRMLALIRHRGPDDQGTWRGAVWQIGMTRLSIIDLEGGQQPMVSRDGRWVIILNGEIYNFRTLRRELQAQGVVFRTRSDTEVLLEWVARYGMKQALPRMEGMFAACLVDTRSNDLWLARDRFGEKPLFVDRREGGFNFCSELSPLLEISPAARRISAQGTVAILRSGYPWPGLTAAEKIASLEPGTWLRRGADGAEDTGRYWEPPDRVDDARHSVSACGAELLRLLEASVSDRLVADVPVGLFLSGGIDSGSVALMVKRQGAAADAVNVGFKEAAYNERPLAEKTAAFLGLRLLAEEAAIDPFTPGFFDDLIRHHGQPFYDTSAVPTRAVSRAARRHFKVVLSGDGGDELLGGYLAHARNERLHRPGMRALGAIMPTPDFLENLPWPRGEHLTRSMALVASVGDGLLPHVMAGVFSDRMILKLTKGTPWEREAKAHLEEARADSRALWFSTRDVQLAYSRYQIRHSLPEEILTKVDRMSMAESLEVRAPFLDSRLAEYALSLPAHLKIRNGVGKWVLREALQGLLPRQVLEAPKRGFALPVRSWLGSSFWASLEKEAQEYERAGAGELNPGELKDRIRRDRNRCAAANDYRALHRAVLLYSFLRWRQTHMGAGRARPA
jgi:asparagine synthase (glutamine-hydrolysing)